MIRLRRGMGPGGECYCPLCGYRAIRTRVGVRCVDIICPKCKKSRMLRIGR